MKIDFNQEEANSLIKLLDITCKAAGLEVAGSCLYFTKKLQDGFGKVDTKQPSAKK